MTRPDELSINILHSSDIKNIDNNMWDKLSNSSIYKNPFYERWNLVPAAHYLNESDDIYIVTIQKKDNLTCLYPIVLKSTFMGCYIEFWKHDHCYESTPLISNKKDFKWSIEQVAKSLNASFILIDLHKDSLLSDNNTRYFSAPYNRAYIHDSCTLKDHSNNVKGKERRELNRLRRNLQHDYAIEFYEDHKASSALNQYIQLEDNGWKGKKKGSINSKTQVRKYYEEMATYADTHKNMAFQVLAADNKIIAMGIRIVSGNNYFEIKTSYDESFKKYAPGKILEYLILESLASKKNIEIDSCTHHNNTLINKIWPDKQVYFRTFIFSNSFLGNLYRVAYSLKQLYTCQLKSRFLTSS